MITNSVQKTDTPLLLSVVVPVFKEEANINPFLERLIPVLDEINLEYEVIFFYGSIIRWNRKNNYYAHGTKLPDQIAEVFGGLIKRNYNHTQGFVL